MRSRIGAVPIVLVILVCVLSSCGGSGYTPVYTPKASSDPSPAPECFTATPFLSGDPNKPVLTLVGAAVINQPVGAVYVDGGATAQDPKDADISSKVTVSDLDTLDVNTVGDYFVRYNVTNSAQLAATEMVRIVRVNSGKSAAQSARKWQYGGGHRLRRAPASELCV